MNEETIFLITCLALILSSAMFLWVQNRNIQIERRDLEEHEKAFLKQLKKN
jgi:hypothetical protein